MNDIEIILGHVREVRTPGAFSERPNIRRRSFQAIINTNMSSLSDFDPCLFEANALCVWDSTKRGENVGCNYRSRAIVQPISLPPVPLPNTITS
jgi:hypothetical protein